MNEVKLASDTAMVLSAGLGKRMRPLTATQPKPLVRVAGKSLIDHALDKLDAAGIEKAVVNVHYLADALEGHLKVRRKGPAITVSDERDCLLETGGGMVKAEALLPETFFCLNSDNIWLDGPVDVFHELSLAWDAERMDALLLMVPHPRAMNYRGDGDFHLDPVGRVTRRKRGHVAPFIYSGIQIVSKRLLREAPEGPFSTNLLWSRAIEEGRLYGISHTGLWFEVGEPSAIRPTEEWLPRA
ncbi:nucleotidyltransferase family protein [Novosphingobium sp. ST904]|uniref:nucleotidyltransferase family protein n=1 Tax=Novosphingobium sp. ST904 TaxID=1684385 RepID=UPI0006C84964|nr:nucleotidyltransferase family protein [Novosphingobium sp. ST904]KPH66385.1 mannose-1-phosphate guanylyltransferase [Novosphingobium sp. ST904]TCM29998.1 MurNAc alpha-1-phosphate uridylyltransferase [Novosphingobium sp. ST904]